MSERDIFLGLLDLPTAAERVKYLDAVCGSDAGLRERVEKLLGSHETAGSFLGTPAAVVPDPDHAGTMAYPATPDPDHTTTRTGGDTSGCAGDEEALGFLTPSARPDSLGRIGHYEVLQVLGRGGFGIVFRAFDDVLQRVVAVKVMAPQLAATSPARKRFLREARTSAAVRHENVVQVYEVAEHPLPYLAMEFIPGETLQQKLDRTGPLDVSEVLRVGRQIAEGLAAAHATDLIHRDIKPANVLIEGGPQQKVKITDFGLARAADDASISQSGIIAGTPMYMAPEQAQGQPLDQRADLFSLGSVLYQMASGRPPFRANTTVAVLKRVAEDTPRDIREIIPETPEWLCNIIAKLHAKNPDDRYQSAREVADVLADCEEQLKANSKLKDFSRIPRTRSASSGRWKWAAAAALMLSVVALAVTEFAGVTHLFRGQPDTTTVAAVDGKEPDPKKSPEEKKVPPQANASDRRVAEYVLSIRGAVRVNEEKQWIDASARLPATPFRLTGIQRLNGRLFQYTGDADLVHIKDCKNLTFLDFRNNNVTDAGLAHLKDCKNLTFLNIADNEVTDAGLAHLKDCKNLTFLGLNNMKVTAAGIDDLAKALPQCRIEWDGGVIGPSPVLPAKQEPLPPTFKNSIGMEFVIVPKGKSWLGGGKDKLGDKEVVIPANFYLGKYEVTQEEWEKVMGLTPSHFSRNGHNKDAVKDIIDADLKRFPVENVSWEVCQVFLERLNKREKETGWVYRLPTEAEWEYACRGGPMSDTLASAFHFYFAKPTNTLLPEQANFDYGKGPKRTCKVGSYEPNALGLYDMHGNVREWCEDTEKAADGASYRVNRSGGWSNDSGVCRAAFRQAYPPLLQSNHLGLRLARVPSGTPSPAAKTPPVAVAPFTDADVRRIAALPAAEQVEEVRKELKRLNPKFDGKLEHKIEGDAVTELQILTDEVVNIAPVRALKGLIYLDCRGTYRDKGKLSDLSPLKGMTLSRLDCSSTQVADLTPLAGVPLTFLHFNHNPVSDLTPLKGMPLVDLGIAETKVSDLSPLKGMKLQMLGAQLLPVTDLTPLQGMPLKGLDLYHTKGATNLQPLKGMPLEGLNLHDVPVSDLSPLKGMTTLRTLHLQGNRVTDLSPLAGLKLTDLLLHDKQITDLSPLKGLPLTRLAIHNTGVRDLSPLQGMPLQAIRLNPKNITQGLDTLRDIKSLKTIGIDDQKAWPAAEFWERYDKGEFKE